MNCDPKKHHRSSIRLKDYDYSTAGAYFVTICTFKRACIFGKILDGEMRMNGVGHVVKKWSLKLGDKFPSVETDAYIIMPSHMHGIVRIVGGDPCVRPDSGTAMEALHEEGARVGAPLPRIVQWFKTMTANQYLRLVKNPRRMSFPGRLWQRNYYEHVIRNETDLNAIRQYIEANPSRWQDDPENPHFVG